MRRAHDSISSHWLGDVLQFVQSEVFELQADLALDMLECGPREENCSRIGNAFEAGRDVDAITVEVALLDHDVAKVNAHSKHDLSLGRASFIRGSHRLL